MRDWGIAIWADRVSFEVRGNGAKQLLSLAAREGIILSRLSCTKNGYRGWVAGGDVHRLHKAAVQSNTELCIRQRRGPGKLLERLIARPGLMVGTAAFFFLQWYLSGFVWTIDFGEMDSARQGYFRTVLAEQGIWEGCRIQEEELRSAEDAIELKIQDAGWLSLNFTGGCLFVEENERQIQEIRQETQPRALYAKTSGQVLSIELESGFAQVTAGQYVAQGQLLANGQKADRKGQAVVQGAAGHILGLVRKTYTAQQPLREEIQLLTGAAQTGEVWHLLGHTWQNEKPDPAPTACAVTEWIPLHLGRLALPGCLCRTTYWEAGHRTETYTEKTAEDMAARACRQILIQEFPDAQLETESLSFETADNIVSCRADYVFRAEIAQPGPLAPIESTQGTS